MKKIAAGVTTALVLVAVLIGAVVRSSGSSAAGGSSAADEPEDCIQQMYQAMKEGDVGVYLDCHTGELRDQLERSAQEQSEGRFADYLKRNAAPLKSLAILHHQSEHSGPDRVRMVVDRVYAQRQWEYQAYRLIRVSGAWKIYQIEPAEEHDPPVPYGTPAFPVASDSDSSKAVTSESQ